MKELRRWWALAKSTCRIGHFSKHFPPSPCFFIEYTSNPLFSERGGLVSSFKHTIGTFSLEQGLRFLTSMYRSYFFLRLKLPATVVYIVWVAQLASQRVRPVNLLSVEDFYSGKKLVILSWHAGVGEKNPLPCLETIINTKTSNDVWYKNTRHNRLKRHEISLLNLFLRFRYSSWLTICIRFHQIRFRIQVFALFCTESGSGINYRFLNIVKCIQFLWTWIFLCLKSSNSWFSIFFISTILKSHVTLKVFLK